MSAAERTQRLLDLSVRELLASLDAPETGPASGFAAALTVAVAASVAGMAARAAELEDASGLNAQAASLQARSLELAVEDAAAYLDATALLADPHGDAALGAALLRAADAPLRIADAAAAAADLAAHVAGRAAGTSGADAAAAAALAEGAARAAAHLVDVNLATMPGDERTTRARFLVEWAGDARRRAQEGDST